ncbi:MAG: hypothetical protein KBC15_00705 [Candidatus Levybacteria bacterium]|nr:hypothetical protein [Candidatus Levybacteria bacterium]
MKNRISATLVAIAIAVVSFATPAMASTTGPSSNTDYAPGVTVFVTEVLDTLATNDASLWTPMFAEDAIRYVPTTTFSDVTVIAIASLSVDRNGDVNVFVVYTGLRDPGGLFYDYMRLKVANGTFVVTGWENRLPRNDG